MTRSIEGICRSFLQTNDMSAKTDLVAELLSARHSVELFCNIRDCYVQERMAMAISKATGEKLPSARNASQSIFTKLRSEHSSNEHRFYAAARTHFSTFLKSNGIDTPVTNGGANNPDGKATRPKRTGRQIKLDSLPERERFVRTELQIARRLDQLIEQIVQVERLSDCDALRRLISAKTLLVQSRAKLKG